MKIGILTLPIGSNIGGVLQAYALQKYIQQQGHEVVLLDRRRNDEGFFWSFSGFRWLLFKSIFGLYNILKGEKEQKIHSFIKKNINCSKEIYSGKSLYECIKRERFDAIIVGSDQVWRKWYHDPGFTDVKEYFLNFLSDIQSPIKIGYAVSFGLEDWDIDDDLVVCREAAKTFKAISVREKSGIDICKKYLKVDATQVLDPTMLLTKNEYVRLSSQCNNTECSEKLLCYILDKSNAIANEISNLERVTGMQSYDYLVINNQNKDICLWLKAFSEAKYILTDSFHGCVFAILFNKPFIALGNEKRGQARFESLLSLFNLQSRLVPVNQPGQISRVMKEDINWNDVNNLIREWRARSCEFLNVTLNSYA